MARGKKKDVGQCNVLVHDDHQCVKPADHVDSKEREEQLHECASGIIGSGVGSLDALKE